jgi:hypothetical protein
MSIALNLDHASTPVRPSAPRRSSLVGLSKPQMREALGAIGLDAREAKMRASQLWNWIYVNGVTDFERMSNIQKGFRQKITSNVPSAWQSSSRFWVRNSTSSRIWGLSSQALPAFWKYLTSSETGRPLCTSNWL